MSEAKTRRRASAAYGATATRQRILRKVAVLKDRLWAIPEAVELLEQLRDWIRTMDERQQARRGGIGPDKKRAQVKSKKNKKKGKGEGKRSSQ